MAWIFLPGSMMMPALAPMDKADPKLTLGYRELQVRGRLVSHLQDFIDNFMDPFDLDHSEIEETPWADYTCRFYTTREAYGLAMANAMMDIDYSSFKIQSERKNPDGTLRYPKGKEYHGVLTSIWGASTRLNPAGGYYGEWSKDNPRGYRPGRYLSGNFVGSTFRRGNDATLWDYEDEAAWSSADGFSVQDDWKLADDNFDYIPSSEEMATEVLGELRGIPVDQWEDFLTPEDFKLVQPYMKVAKREEKRASRRARRRQKNRRNADVTF